MRLHFFVRWISFKSKKEKYNFFVILVLLSQPSLATMAVTYGNECQGETHPLNATLFAYYRHTNFKFTITIVIS